MSKKCRTCGIDLIDGNYRESDLKSYNFTCIACERIRCQKWRLKNLDREKENKRKWRAKNPEKDKDYAKNYRTIITDYYILQSFSSNLRKELIDNKSFINAKRQIILIKRELRKQL